MDTINENLDQQPTPNAGAEDVTAVSKKYLARNMVSNIVFAMFNALTSLIMVSFLVRKLGCPTME